MEILNAVKLIGGTVLTIGIALFMVGIFANGYSLMIALGTGTVIGAVFIFLMGVFLVASEEMLRKTHEGNKKILS
ncbi:hypothetical protein [Aquibacillus salsiterrae]|uniref:Uncharacterized protein n=1 Tax=Aquibacillus salsiterrae TaxID=2950439 RepID=A0A9X3WGT7_9BACI|nr:hypothetical protein [Aquibacillus salsiterrae]MDC3416761.1 hypothetical protein [Aquibacillus salsiterrae]